MSAGGACFDTAEWQRLNVADHVLLRISGFSHYGTGSLFRELRGSGLVLRIQAPEDGEQGGRARVVVRFDRPPRFEVYDWAD